jgi:hypothetical protein
MKELSTELRNFSIKITSKTGERPKHIPISDIEMDKLFTEHPCLRPWEEGNSQGEIYGSSMWKTPYSREIRTKACEPVNLSMSRYIEEVKTTEQMMENLNLEVIKEHLKYAIIANVATDTTEVKIELEFECDPWAKIKSKLRLTKWFPVKKVKKTVVIDGRVLYPYLNVQFPQNRHTVKLFPRP